MAEHGTGCVTASDTIHRHNSMLFLSEFLVQLMYWDEPGIVCMLVLHTCHEEQLLCSYCWAVVQQEDEDISVLASHHYRIGPILCCQNAVQYNSGIGFLLV